MLNVSTSGHSRFQDKLDKVFWFIIVVLPLVFMLVFNIVPVSVLADTDKEEEVIEEVVEEVVEDNYAYYVNIELVIFRLEGTLPEHMPDIRIYLVGDSSSYVTFDACLSTYNNSSDSYYILDSSSDDGLYYPFNSPCRLRIYDIDNRGLIDSLNWVTDSLSFSLSEVVFESSYGFTVEGRPPTNVTFERVAIQSVPPAEDTPTEDESTVEEEKNTYTFITLKNVLVDCFGLDVDSKNGGGIVGRGLSDMFGKDGVFPVFTADSGMMYYMTYVVYVEILHVFVDLLLFIPRFAHKILSKAINFGD